MLKIFCDNIEQQAKDFLLKIEDSKLYGNIVAMPDCHSGRTVPVGTTIQLKNNINPNYVGGDIGCGMFVVELSDKKIKNVLNFKQLDKVIRQTIPHGLNVNKTINKYCDFFNEDLKELTEHFHQRKFTNIKYNLLSLGTLGGSNHFIELDKDDEDDYYLVIHTGSRHLGQDIALYHSKLASKTNNILSDEDKEDYLIDMQYAVDFAKMNRYIIARTILESLGYNKMNKDNYYNCIHNYIDIDANILRKGAIDASLNKQVIIPLNMRDGAILGTGLGNKEWNCSAPHGAGRKFSCLEAKETLSMEEYKHSMKDIFTTSVKVDTIDESPMSYKDKDDIISQIENNTVKINKIIKPVYNFKDN